MSENPGGLGRVFGLTLLTAALPGAGYLAARRPLTGALLLTAQLTLAAVVTVVLFRHRADLDVLLVSPQLLGAVLVAAPATALAWAAAVLQCAFIAGRGLRFIEDRVLCGLVAGLVALAICIPLGAAGWYAGLQRELLTGVFAPPAATRPASGDRLNLLLLGGDGGAHRLGRHTDSITVASIDRRTGDTILFGLPRDLQRVPFPKGGALARRFPNGFDDTLGAVYAFGQGHPESLPGKANPGGAAVAQAASQVLGLRIDNFVLVDMAGFADLVDAWGGLPLTVRQRLPYEPNGSYLEPGRHTLSGQEVLRLARTRNGGGDYARMARHRCVLAALADRPDPFTIMLRYHGLVGAAKRSVTTDIQRSQVPELVRLARRVHAGSFSSVELTPPALDPANPDFPRVRRIVAASLRERPDNPAPIEAGPLQAACPS